MKYLPLVWVALCRKPTRAALTLLAVTFGFTLFGLMIALDASYRRVIETARMDRLYVNSRFGAPLGLPISLEEQIRRIDGVTAVGAFRWVFGYYQDRRNPLGVYTVDAGMRRAMDEFPLSSQQWDQLLQSSTGVFVTRKVARRWGFKQGDVVPISVEPGTRADGASSWAFHVLGVVPDHPEWNNGVVIGNYRSTENARPLDSQGYALGFRVAMADSSHASDTARRIDHRFANSGAPTVSVSARASAISQARSGIAIASMTWGVGGAGLFMILFLVGNSIAQSVRRRIPEFAALKALGFTSANITALVLVEAAVPCLIGAALGTALAAALAGAPRAYMPEGLLRMPQPVVSTMTLAWALGFAVLLAVLGATLPMIKLKRMNVAVALSGRMS